MEHMAPLLQLTDISKRFAGVKALDSISISIDEGEVMSLAGENGAGKSTLVKIISGAVSRDSGEIRIEDEALPLQYSPAEARKCGIAMIYQELSLLPESSVAENIFIGHEPTHIPWLGIIDDKRMQERAKELLHRLQADHINVTDKVRSLPLPEQHMVEIAKALAIECKIFVMDEPTTSLSGQETKQLFNVIRLLKSQGVTVIYISHHLEELFEIVDSVTVLRDGTVAGREKIGDLDKEKLIYLMTGKEISSAGGISTSVERTNAPLLEVRGIMGEKLPHPVSFSVHENEIVGFGGLVGSKRTELARVIFGADRAEGGEVIFAGQKIIITSPNQAVRHGIGYLSENRKEEGLSLGMSIEENIVHTNMNAISWGIFFLWDKVRSICARFIDTLYIKGRHDQTAQALSGGNQQKVVLAKWLHAKCRLLIFDEPTRGIDVGAKAEIHNLIKDFASEGRAAIVISTEIHELIDVCDRILIMSRGEITHELSGEEISEANILHSITTQRSNT